MKQLGLFLLISIFHLSLRAQKVLPAELFKFNRSDEAVPNMDLYIPDFVKNQEDSIFRLQINMQEKIFLDVNFIDLSGTVDTLFFSVYTEEDRKQLGDYYPEFKCFDHNINACGIVLAGIGSRTIRFRKGDKKIYYVMDLFE